VSNANPVAGAGIDSALIGTIKSGNALQVTYNRWPLYTYAGDSAAGRAKGQGLDGIWFAVTPAGTKASTSTPSSSATSTGGSSVGY
jgi:hypothetical protein